MFELEQPSMALNDTRLNVTVQMAVTRSVLPAEGLDKILEAVVKAAKDKGGKLKNLVINCHGEPSYLNLGLGVDRPQTMTFRMLAPGGKPLVDVIYLRACNVARIDKPGGEVTGDGNLFCCEIAKNAKCRVVASTATQTTAYTTSTGHPLPYGLLDKFEGTTLVYGPEGNVLSSSNNPMFTKWSFDNE